MPMCDSTSLGKLTVRFGMNAGIDPRMGPLNSRNKEVIGVRN